MILQKLGMPRYNQITILINSSITFIWWIIFNPGFFAPDSLGILNMVKSGVITSEYTQIWGLSIRLFSLDGEHPQLATLVFSQILSISFSIFVIQIFQKKVARYSSLILHLTPTLGAMSITLWHDVPATAGFFLALTGLLLYEKSPAKAMSLIFLGFFFSAFRYNGLFTIFVLSFLFSVATKRIKLTALVAVLGLTLGVGFYSLDVRNSKEIDAYSDGSVNWMRYDLSCFASIRTERSDAFFEKNFGSSDDVEFWASKSACTWFNESEAWLKRNTLDNGKIRETWVKLFLADPMFVLTTHIQRHSYLVPLPLPNLPRPPFLHTKVDENLHDLNFTFPALAESARNFPRAWNYFNHVFSWAGLWLAITVGLGIWRRNSPYLIVGSLGCLISLGLFITSVISDGRYALFILLAGQVIAIGTFLQIAFKKLQRRKITRL
jgi:hypothetical protein